MIEHEPNPDTPTTDTEIVESAELIYVPIRALGVQERGLHWLLFGIGSAVFVMSLLMNAQGQSTVFLPGAAVPMPELCSTKMWFGTECPGCGLTRAFISISHGQFGRAWHFNPASFLVYLFIVGQIPWQGIQLFRVYRGSLPIQSNWLYAVPASAGAALIIQWICKIIIRVASG